MYLNYLIDQERPTYYFITEDNSCGRLLTCSYAIS